MIPTFFPTSLPTARRDVLARRIFLTTTDGDR
jgi:hypothetical protein